MTNNWTNEYMQGYCKCTEQEARRMFRQRYRREPEKVIVIQDVVCKHYYLGPVEDKHGKR